jgi:hypothetical protein
VPFGSRAFVIRHCATAHGPSSGGLPGRGHPWAPVRSRSARKDCAFRIFATVIVSKYGAFPELRPRAICSSAWVTKALHQSSKSACSARRVGRVRPGPLLAKRELNVVCVATVPFYTLLRT